MLISSYSNVVEVRGITGVWGIVDISYFISTLLETHHSISGDAVLFFLWISIHIQQTFWSSSKSFLVFFYAAIFLWSSSPELHSSSLGFWKPSIVVHTFLCGILHQVKTKEKLLEILPQVRLMLFPFNVSVWRDSYITFTSNMAPWQVLCERTNKWG